MFAIVSKLVHKPIITKNITINECVLRSFKFWNKCQNNNNSSNSVTNSSSKVSLAYYSLDPHYLTQNKSNPIIIYHNLFTSKDMYQTIVKQLAEQTQRTVYLLDMRNHGESPHIDEDNSDLNSLAKDVKDFMEEFKIEKAVLLGHGVGSLAMLRTSLLFGDKVEKVAAIDITPIDMPQFGAKLIDNMFFAVSALPQNIKLSFARLIVKRQLNRHFRDKTLFQYILRNLRVDDKGFIKWRFNLPVIRKLLHTGLEKETVNDKQYSGQVLIISGKYGSMTADNYTELKNWFPNASFDFYQRFRHRLSAEKPKQLVNILVGFIGKPNKVTPTNTSAHF